MTIKRLPVLNRPNIRNDIEFEIPESIRSKWDPTLKSAVGDQSNTISILEPIGRDPFSGGGVTAARVSAALRSITAKEIVLDINSPGGLAFEGMSIYNLLREDKRKVTARILGLAASAAATIALAADEVLIGQAAAMLVHNVSGLTIGGADYHRQAAKEMDAIDESLRELYRARTGTEDSKISRLMRDETLMVGQMAIDSGFADGFLPADAIAKGEATNSAASASLAHQLDTFLAKMDIPRSKRRAIINEIRGSKPGATAEEGTRDATQKIAEIDPAVIAQVRSALADFRVNLKA